VDCRDSDSERVRDRADRDSFPPETEDVVLDPTMKLASVLEMLGALRRERFEDVSVQREKLSAATPARSFRHDSAQYGARRTKCSRL
jgi:hypothetical protein